MALDVGKIFYSDQHVIAYSSLGIGRLIYQLPMPLCKMFIKEIFGDKSPDDFDEETIATINKFFENNSSDEKAEGQEKEDLTKPRVVQRYSQYTEQNTDIQDFTDHVEETNIAQSENNLVSETNILKAKSFFEKIKEKILTLSECDLNVNFSEDTNIKDIKDEVSIKLYNGSFKAQVIEKEGEK